DSTPETGVVVSSFCGRRLRYVRTESTLPAAENWNFALSQATGDYVLMLADDDYLMPTWAAQMKQVIDRYAPQIVTSGFVSYRPGRQGTVQIEKVPFDHQRYWFDSDAVVRQSLRTYHLLDADVNLPPLAPFRFHPSVICFQREIYQRSFARYGTFFVYPETTSGYLFVYGLATHYFHVNSPLCIIGRYPDSHTVRPSTTWENFETEMLHVPMTGQYITNLVVETYLRLLSMAGDLFNYVDRNIRVGYFTAYYADMMKQQKVNLNFAADYEEFARVVEQLPVTQRAIVEAAMQTHAEGVAERVRTNSQSNSTIGRIQRRLYRQLKVGNGVHPPRTESGWFQFENSESNDLRSLANWVTSDYETTRVG
ncbi:MAG: glycosyltransferase family 2 protein, partial [Caldilineaceae bacterium]|nr:glycosyltransferase family 2 protein [Caldilineaceae bacterium]